MYNHGITGVTLSELYGTTNEATDARIAEAIQSALRVTYDLQDARKRHPSDAGGWRYWAPDRDGPDSDLSITSWQLMFMRAAKNAGFDVARGALS